MRQTLPGINCQLAFTLLAWGVLTPQAATEECPPDPLSCKQGGEVIVKMTKAPEGLPPAFLRRWGGLQFDPATTVGEARFYRVRAPEATTDELVDLFNQPAARSNGVEYVEPNFTFREQALPEDPYFKDLWGLRNTRQVVHGKKGKAGSDISAEAAWDVTMGTADIVVGVLDSGINATHPDILAQPLAK